MIVEPTEAQTESISRAGSGSVAARVWVAVVCAIALVGLGACGGNGESKDNTTQPPPGGNDLMEDAGGGVDAADAGETAPDVEMPDPDVEPADASEDGGMDTGDLCGGESCGDDETCLDDSCVPRDEAKCQQAEELGELNLGGALTIDESEGFDSEVTDVLDNECTERKDGSSEKVYTFEVPEQAMINYTLSPEGDGNWTSTVDLRQGGCLEAVGEYGRCEGRDSGEVFGPAGSTWYLVVEGDIGDLQAFQLTLEATEACSTGPPGDSACDSGNRYLCERVDGTPTEKKFDCPADCTGGECYGTTCSNPITINGAGDGGSYVGDLAAYSPERNFANADSSCKPNPDAQVEINSPGPEVIFEVTAEADDEIVVDTSGDDHDNLVYITRSCDSDTSNLSCETAWDADGETTWTVPENGTYWVFIDKLNEEAGDPEGGTNMEYNVDVR